MLLWYPALKFAGAAAGLFQLPWKRPTVFWRGVRIGEFYRDKNKIKFIFKLTWSNDDTAVIWLALEESTSVGRPVHLLEVITVRRSHSTKDRYERYLTISNQLVINRISPHVFLLHERPNEPDLPPAKKDVSQLCAIEGFQAYKFHTIISSIEK